MSNTGDLRKILKKIEIFSSLNDEALSLIGEKMKRVVLKPGDIICNEGDTGDSMYAVTGGEVDVLKESREGIPVKLTSLKQGEVAGIMCLFDEDKRSATLQASGEAELWEIDNNDFNELLRENPDISRALLNVFSRYLREEIEVVAELRSDEADERLKVAVFDSKPYTEVIFRKQNKDRYALKFFDARLNDDTFSVANGFKVVCIFVNDDVNASVVKKLKKLGVELIVLRSAGYNNVDIEECNKAGITVARVPAYSPYAVAEHAIALMMALNRHIHRAHNRVREGNFSLNGLVGFDIYGKTAGIIGAGKIGQVAIDILSGFGCNILVYNRTPKDDPRENVRYVALDDLLEKSDIISLHAPLTPQTSHLIDEEAISKMKPGVMLINTSRGGLVDTRALIKGLVSGKIGSAGLDVYEEESGYFFEDYSDSVLNDETLARLTTFNNVMITSHMGFLTDEALTNIVDTTYLNIEEFENGKRGSELTNAVVSGD